MYEPLYVFHLERVDISQLEKYLFWSRDWKLEDELEFFINPDFVEPAKDIDYILDYIETEEEKALFKSKCPEQPFQFILIPKGNGIWGDKRNEDDESGVYRDPESTDIIEYLGLYNGKA
ncbi:hypothetical protein [Enterovibrio norvegicus]|uniref:hypothetical protein n=1 Tax=Enterovibrio norvegicus TaxID=188144 RepID=UPI000C85DE71|nr:hypothetical protein [Enterovibrio norvegicus]PMN70506.1 hypothetical protein BCT27_01975 [Enterovibrio norvegicus]